MRRVLRIAGTLLVALAVLAGLAVAGIYLASERALSAPAVASTGFDPAGGSSEHGKPIAESFGGCESCHGADLGGAPIVTDPNLATLWAPNLTRGNGGIGNAYGDADFELALRHGVRPSGGAFIVMPSSSYAAFSDQDVRDLIAYVRSVAPVDRTTPPRALGPVARVLLAFGKLQPENVPLPSGLPPLATTPEAGTVDFGHYLAATGGCMKCHGANLGGAPPERPNVPPGPDLTTSGAAANWTPDQFVSTIRDGQNPSGHFLDKSMPSESIGRMTDDELNALDLYLKSVPAAHA